MHNNLVVVFDHTRKYYKAGGIERTTFLLQNDLGDLLKIRVKHTRIVDICFLKVLIVRPMTSQNT